MLDPETKPWRKALGLLGTLCALFVLLTVVRPVSAAPHYLARLDGSERGEVTAGAFRLDSSRDVRLPVVEDDFNAGMMYEGDEPLPLRGMEGGEEVILLGTFSKVLFPGIRLGWMVLPEAVREKVGEIRGYTDLGAPVILQQAMLEFCSAGHLDRHLEKMRKVNGKRLDTLLTALEAHFPRRVSWTRPRGGMSVWVTLPEGTDVLRIHRESRDAGVRFSPGVLFHPDRGGENAFRLTFIRESEERIAEGIATLGRIIKKQLRRRPTVTAEQKTKDVWI